MALEIYGKGDDLTIDNLKAAQLSKGGSPSGEDSSDPNTSESPKQTDTAKPTPTQKPDDTTAAPGDHTNAQTSEPANQNGGCKSTGGWAVAAIAVFGGCSALVAAKKKR